jgi:hypothetical protein
MPSAGLAADLWLFSGDVYVLFLRSLLRSPRSKILLLCIALLQILISKTKPPALTWVLAGGIAAPLLTSFYVWMILGVMKKINSWFDVFTV